MAIKKETIPVPPWKGLYLDGVSVPGGCSKFENGIILADGTAERRPFERTLADTEACVASRGTKEVYELLKNNSARYIFADIDNSETYTSAFGTEGVANFSGWTDPADWSYGSSKWTHAATGTVALVATGEAAIVASTQYRVVVGATCPAPSTSTGNWAYTSTDSGFTFTSATGTVQKVWLQKWTHSAGATTPLTTAEDFTPKIGASYVVSMYVDHTSGTGLTVAMGGITAGTIASDGTHTFIVRYCSAVTPLKFTPSSNWVGSINKTRPKAKSKLDNWVSVVKLLDPAGPNVPSNYDYSESTHTPRSIYLNGAELINQQINSWYPEVAAMISQSVAITLGSVAVGTITSSGEYSYDVITAAGGPGAVALTFTPTTSWGGDILSASVKKMTQATAANKTKVIGGEVSGTIDYEVTWANIITDLISGDSVLPQWTTLQDKAFRVDGSNPNYYFENASTYYTLGIPAPADAPTTTNTTGGVLTAGDYNVYYTYVRKSGDYVVEGNPSPAAYTTVTDTAIIVSLVACTDSKAGVTHIRVYRTLYGEPGSFAYYDTETINRTGTVTLVLTDDDIRSTITTL